MLEETLQLKKPARNEAEKKKQKKNLFLFSWKFIKSCSACSKHADFDELAFSGENLLF